MARADDHALTRAHPDPAPDRRGCAADRKPHQDHVGGHRDEADPRQLLIRGGQAQTVQRDLGQPRLEQATTGD
ncbi:MAG: hypothetical protein WB710_14675, partial [Stellaceae bacterium]